MSRLLPALWWLFLAAAAGGQDFPLADPVPVPARGSNVIAEPGGGFYALTASGAAPLDDPRVLAPNAWAGHTDASVAAVGYRSVAVLTARSLYGIDPDTSRTRWIVPVGSSSLRIVFDGTNYVAVAKEGGNVRLRWIDEDGNVLRDTVVPARLSSADGDLAIARWGSMVVVAWHAGSRIDLTGGERALERRSDPPRTLATAKRVSLLTAATDGTRDRIAWSSGERALTFANVTAELRLVEPLQIDGAAPYLAVSGGRMIDAWRDAMGILRGPEGSLARELSHDFDADVAWTGDRYLAAWVRTGDAHELVLRTYDRNGRPLGEPRVIARTPGFMRSARVAAADGTALVAWATHGPGSATAQLHAARVTVAGLQAEESPLGDSHVTTWLAAVAGRGEFLLLWIDDAGVRRRVVPASGPVTPAEPELLIERGTETPVCAVDAVLAGSRYHLAFTLCHPPRVVATTYTAYLAEVTSYGGFARRLPIDRADAVASGGGTTLVFRHEQQLREAVAVDRTLRMAAGGSVKSAVPATAADAAFTGSRFLFVTTRDYTWFDGAGKPIGIPVTFPSQFAAGARVAVAGDGRDGAMLVWQWGSAVPARTRMVRAE